MHASVCLRGVRIGQLADLRQVRIELIERGSQKKLLWATPSNFLVQADGPTVA